MRIIALLTVSYLLIRLCQLVRFCFQGNELHGLRYHLHLVYKPCHAPRLSTITHSLGVRPLASHSLRIAAAPHLAFRDPASLKALCFSSLSSTIVLPCYRLPLRKAFTGRLHRPLPHKLPCSSLEALITAGLRKGLYTSSSSSYFASHFVAARICALDPLLSSQDLIGVTAQLLP